MSSTNKKVAEFEDYPTPRPLVEALFKHIDWDALRHFASYDNRPARFLEPCRGLKRNIYDLVPSDFERYYCEIQEGLDYLETDLSGIHFDIIVTNPLSHSLKNSSPKHEAKLQTTGSYAS